MEHWHIILISAGIQTALGILVVFIGFLLKRAIVQIDKRLEDGDMKFKEISTQLSDLKEKRALDREYMAKEYVSKDDFIRDIRALDVKIDGVAADVKELLRQRRDQNAEI